MKPDQLIKRRGKLGLIHVKGNTDSVYNWIKERINKPIRVERAEGTLKNFIVEPFLKHSDDEEAYVCIYSVRDCDVIMFHKQGTELLLITNQLFLSNYVMVKFVIL